MQSTDHCMTVWLVLSLLFFRVILLKRQKDRLLLQAVVKLLEMSFFKVSLHKVLHFANVAGTDER